MKAVNERRMKMVYNGCELLSWSYETTRCGQRLIVGELLVPIGKITMAEPYSRKGRVEVKRYKEMYLNGSPFPFLPATEEEDGSFRIFDGHKRLQAMRELGFTTIHIRSSLKNAPDWR